MQTPIFAKGQTLAVNQNIEDNGETILNKGAKVVVISVDPDGNDFAYTVQTEGDDPFQTVLFEMELSPFPEEKPQPRRKAKATEEESAEKPATKAAAKPKPALDEDASEEERFDEEVATEGDDSETVSSKLKRGPKPKTKPKAKEKEVPAKKEPVKQESATEAEGQAPEVINTAEVAQILHKSGNDPLAAAKAVKEAIDDNFFTLGGVLAHVQRTRSYLNFVDQEGNKPYVGKEGFIKYCDEQLDISYRKAYFLISIYRKVTEKGLDGKLLIKLGWAKAAQLADYINAENEEYLVSYASEHTLEQVKDYVKQVREGNGEAGNAGERVTKTVFRFSLVEDKGKTVADALEVAGQECGSDDINERFHYIVSQWLIFKDANSLPLDEFIQNAEIAYGVKLVVEEDAVPSTNRQAKVSA